MSTDEYNTVTYQRVKMWDALGLALVCLISLVLACWFDRKGFVGYISAFGFLVGTRGFFEHRKYMRQLKKAEVENGGEQHAQHGMG